jgi:hypothetical protein
MESDSRRSFVPSILSSLISSGSSPKKLTISSLPSTSFLLQPSLDPSSPSEIYSVFTDDALWTREFLIMMSPATQLYYSS